MKISRKVSLKGLHSIFQPVQQKVNFLWLLTYGFTSNWSPNEFSALELRSCMIPKTLIYREQNPTYHDGNILLLLERSRIEIQ